MVTLKRSVLNLCQCHTQNKTKNTQTCHSPPSPSPPLPPPNSRSRAQNLNLSLKFSPVWQTVSTPTYRTVWREADILDFFCAPLQLLTTVTWGHTWTDRALLLWIPGLLWHKRTRIPPWPPVTHTRLHSQRTLTFTLVRGHTPPLPSPRPFKIHNHHSLCKIHTHHVCSATLYPQPLCPTCTHTHTHTHFESHTHTLLRGPLVLLPLHLAGAICSTRFVSGCGKAALGWWCREASWWRCLSWLMEDFCRDLGLERAFIYQT